MNLCKYHLLLLLMMMLLLILLLTLLLLVMNGDGTASRGAIADVGEVLLGKRSSMAELWCLRLQAWVSH